MALMCLASVKLKIFFALDQTLIPCKCIHVWCHRWLYKVSEITSVFKSSQLQWRRQQNSLMLLAFCLSNTQPLCVHKVPCLKELKDYLFDGFWNHSQNGLWTSGKPGAIWVAQVLYELHVLHGTKQTPETYETITHTTELTHSINVIFNWVSPRYLHTCATLRSSLLICGAKTSQSLQCHWG